MKSTPFERRTSAILLLFMAGSFAFVMLLEAASTPTPEPVPTPIDVSKIDFSKFKPDEIAATEKHRNELKGEVKSAHERQAEVIVTQGSSISEIAVAAGETEAAFNAYRSAAEAQINKGNQAIAAWEAEHKKHGRAQMVLIALWIAVVGFIVVKLPMAVKQYGLIGGAVAAFTGILFIKLWL